MTVSTVNSVLPGLAWNNNASTTYQYFTNYSTEGTTSPNTTAFPILNDLFPCKWILYEEIGGSRVRIWDLMIFIPNIFFLLFLLLKVKKARQRLQQSNSPVFSSFIILVFLNSLIGVIRCIVSMSVNAALEAGDIADKMLWLLLRFFMLFTEMSVIVFGIAFGHLDSRSSIKRVILVTSAIALIYSGTQGVLEIAIPDTSFHIESRGFDIFAHGGMLFWFISSMLFTMIYVTVFILPWTPLNNKVALPVKKSFYFYCVFLALLNLIQCIGSAMLYFDVLAGMCMVDATTYIYFTCFTPLVYQAFLSEFFGSVNLNILFSYRSHVDEGDVAVGGGDVVGGGGGGGDASAAAAAATPTTYNNNGGIDVQLYNNSELYDSFTTRFMLTSGDGHGHGLSPPTSQPPPTTPPAATAAGPLAVHFTGTDTTRHHTHNPLV